jgi:predicted naringenin-chalcone synthase
MSCVLTDFRPIAARHSIAQRDFRENLTAAIRGEAGLDDEALAALVEKYTVSPDCIERRFIEVPSVYTRPGEADCDVSEAMMDARMRIYDEAACDVLRRAFRPDEPPPDDLIHVTCSGYNSPSPAQRLVSEYGWPSIVTHSYHMGCAGAFPAVRMASGFLAAGALYGRKSRVDLLHTELLSVHATSARQRLDPEGLILRSLFGDGLIRYSAIDERSLPARRSGLRVLSLKEHIFRETLDDMTWRLFPEKFKMTLSNRVPFVIAGNIEQFAQEIFAQVGLEFDAHRADMVFAIHPGGPKIVDLVQRFLRLEDWQVRHSREVLRDCGNMSSATVPHIWERILADRSIAEGTRVLGVGFGPGLAAHGMLGEKV